MSVVPLNPKPMLMGLVNNDVIVRLKWGTQEYRGRLVSTDSYMNLQLSGAEEYSEGEPAGTLGDVLIRCNNVLWISKADSPSKSAAERNGDRDPAIEL
ncbi:LSM domain-containing protein [Aulographum hederae CBS 113979]|uniref:Sm protein F n=1 Tax=Aulographum hederae CBS 113979 TaxID=1176131 RepID=A0A6G1GVH0_9PEZI|nr:LSM domain-containing protein [Aulographum hederae CBS 113979]